MADVIGNPQERDAFEAELQVESRRRLDATVARAVTLRNGAYDEDLHLAVVRNLFERFTRDKDPLMEHFSGLRQLPMDDESRAQRLAAFEEILHHYLPRVLREELPADGNEDPAGVSRESFGGAPN